jgi:ABC-type branched-subunit amino acid transport system substrate-binding protein
MKITPWLVSFGRLAAGLFTSAPGLAIAAGFFVAVAAQADPGVFQDKIVFGQSAAFEGPAAALGRGIREGILAAFNEANVAGGVNGRILAAFNEANVAGGVNGRKLELVGYDDGYEPERAIKNTIRLIKDDKVFALIGEVGTPTSKAAQPIATDAGVPFIGPFTGAEFLRNPYKRTVINVRGSYYQETEAMVEHLTSDLRVSRIAILYQDDSYGRAGLAGVKRALGNIKVSKRVRMDPIFLNVSFVGSKALAKELGKHGQGVVVTQVVPFPEDTSIPLVAQYRKALKASGPDAEPGFVSLEGYMVGRLVLQALEKLGGVVTRDGLLATIARVGTFDLGGVTLTYGRDDNQGMDQVFLTVIESDGSFKAVKQLER